MKDSRSENRIQELPGVSCKPGKQRQLLNWQSVNSSPTASHSYLTAVPTDNSAVNRILANKKGFGIGRVLPQSPVRTVADHTFGW
jgi:hypothetical protein